MAHRANPPCWRLACALACAAIAGCASLPRIDPTGERVLIWPKDQPQVAAPLLAPSSTIVAPPVGTDAVFPQLPVVATAPAVATAPGVTPASLALAQVPQDKVTILPERILAPVNSEVVLKASVCTTEGFTLADQKVEWMLGRNGVGQFVEVSGKGLFHPALLPWNQPKKIDNYLAQGWTASDKLCITRGTADPADDVNILRGDAWVTVTSPNEGTSYVTAYMPTVESWEQRRSSATIYWVDVQWTFPPGSVASDGRSATLTTTVTRQTNGAPIEGWLVRYELADGGGSLAGAGTGQVVEVRTDANGQATVQATPTASGASSTPVNIQLIRPAGFGGGDAPRLIIGTGSSLIQWSGGGAYLPPSSSPATGNPITPIPTLPDSAGPVTPPSGWTPSTGGGTAIPPIPAQRPELQLQVTGEQTANVGGVARLTMVVVNTGTAPATNVRVVDQFDAGLMLPDNPDARELELTGIAQAGPLAPGASSRRDMTFNVMQAGRLCHNFRVTSAEGAEDSAQFCVTATQQPEAREGRVDVTKEGLPKVATVGETVRFRVTVKNTGDLPLVDVRVVDEYSPTYFQITPPPGANVVSGVIQYQIERLERGDSRTFEVDALCLQPAVPLLERPLVKVTAQTDPPRFSIPDAAEVEMEIRPPNAAAGAAPADAAAGAATGARPPLVLVTSFLQKPARIGTRTLCEVTIYNSSPVNDEGVELKLIVPPQLKPDLTALGAEFPPGVRGTLNGAQLSFSPLAQLRPGERVAYRIPMTVVGPAGFAEVSTDVRSRNYTSGAPRRDPLEITNL